MNFDSKHYRWELLVLLSCAFFFHQFDRAIFGSVLTQIRTDLSLTGKQTGLASSSLFLVLAVLIPLAGFASDRWNRKRIVVLSLIVGSVGTFLTGLSGGVLGLILFRSILTGGAGAFYAPAAYPLIAEHHRETRSIAMAVHQAALYFSLMSSGFLAVYIARYLTWRGTYVLFGSLGILLAVLMNLRLHKEPGMNRSTIPGHSPRQATKRFFTNHKVLCLTFGYMSIVFVNNAYVVWAPSFVEAKFGLSALSAAGYSMFYHHIAAFVGIILGGLLTDRFVVRYKNFRPALQSAALLFGVPCILLFGMGGSLAAIWWASALFGFFRGLFEANTHASVFEHVEPEHRGSTVGLMTMTAYLIGSFSPLLLGSLVSRFGESNGLSFGFTFLALAYLFGSVFVFLVCFEKSAKNDPVSLDT